MCFLYSWLFPKKSVKASVPVSILRNFPVDFWGAISTEQVEKIVLFQHSALKEAHNGIQPYDKLVVEYKPEVYGSTLSYGIALGDSAKASLNNNHPRWEVTGHEQGHNFFGGTSSFYYELVKGTPFLQEALAVTSSVYTYHWIKDNVTNSITQETLDSLDYVMKNEISYQITAYTEYKKNKVFNISDVLTSQALDGLMIELFNEVGWDKFKLVTKSFVNRTDIVTDQVTYICASLSQIKDMRDIFKELFFPVDNLKFEKYSIIVKK
jgi:hypothetical protein